MVGQLLASLSYGLNYMFLTQINWNWLYLELVNDLCGTYVSYYIAEYSFITDITQEAQRQVYMLYKMYSGTTIIMLGPTDCPWWTGWTM